MRLAIAVPAHDNVSALFANDLAKLYAVTCAALPAVTLAMVTGTFVHHARERLLDDVVSLWGATHVLWLDSDMTFPADAALRLLAHDRDIVAANYMTRVAPSRPTAKRDGRSIFSQGAGGIEEVDHVGMGVFLMRAAIAAELPRPRFFYSTPTETEDVYFCRLLQNAGHVLYIDHDLSHAVGHIGQQVYREPAPVPVHD